LTKSKLTGLITNARGFDITSMHVDALVFLLCDIFVGDPDTAIYEKVECIALYGLITV